MQGASTPVLVRTSRPTQDPQGGRTKFIRLLARAVGPDGNPLPVILPDVSEPFAVRSSLGPADARPVLMPYPSKPNTNKTQNPKS